MDKSNAERILLVLKNKSMDLVSIPVDRTIIEAKLVYKNKYDEHDTIIRNKARFVIQEYNQDKGINFDENFAPVARIGNKNSDCLSCIYRVKTIPNGCEKCIYLLLFEGRSCVKQPLGFEDIDQSNHVLKLDMDLYRFK